MQKLVDYLLSVDRSWLITWVVIYVGFLLADAITPGEWYVTLLKYGGIFLCLVYGIQKYRSDVSLELALLFTLLADTILVMDSTSIIGVFVFCLAQFFHLARFRNISPATLAPYSLIVMIVFFFGVQNGIIPMFAIAFVYGMTLILNLILSQKWYRHEPSAQSLCAASGFSLFLCCDLCVACSYLSLIGVLAPFIYPLANYFSWFFYYPSQVLISNSSKQLIS